MALSRLSFSGIAARSAKRRQVDALMKRLSELIDFKHQTYYENLKDKLHKRTSQELLDQLPELLNGDPEIAAGVATLLSEAMESEARIRDVPHFHSLLGSKDFWETDSLVYPLRSYEIPMHDDTGAPVEFLSHGGAAVHAQCLALMMATRRLDEGAGVDVADDTHPVWHQEVWTGEFRYIKDAALVRLIKDHPAEMERIVDTYLEYRPADAQAVLGIMEGSPPAVAEGFL